MQRAVEIGDERAAAEVGVARATLRSWRRRLKAEGSAPAPAKSAAAVSAPAAPAAPAVVGDGDENELERAERELAEVRAARASALARSVELARAGNDLSAQHAARAARDFATAARALSAEVALLRESGARLDEAGAQLMADVVEGFLRALGIPWSKPFRALLRALVLEREAAEDRPDIGPLAERAASELRQHFARQLGRPAPVALSAGDDLPDDELLPEPDGGPLDVPAAGAPAADEHADAEPLELVALSEVPPDFRARFALGAEGGERARVAWSQKLRDEQRRREDAEREAEQAAERPAAQAPRRIPRTRSVPNEWDRGGRRRGRGPSGQAGP